MSLIMKLKPELEPRPRTAGGSMTSTRASRMEASSRVARCAISEADWPGSGRSSQVFSRTKARAEAWSPFRPETW